MNYKEMKNTIEQMANENYEDFTKALISFEKGVNDKEALDILYDNYTNNDSLTLLNEEFDYMIDELRESGQIKENESLEKEDNDLVNIVGNVVGEVEQSGDMSRDDFKKSRDVFLKKGNFNRPM